MRTKAPRYGRTKARIHKHTPFLCSIHRLCRSPRGPGRPAPHSHSKQPPTNGASSNDNGRHERNLLHNPHKSAHNSLHARSKNPKSHGALHERSAAFNLLVENPAWAACTAQSISNMAEKTFAHMPPLAASSECYRQPLYASVRTPPKPKQQRKT